MHVLEAGLQQEQRTETSQDGGISTVTTNMRNTQLEEHVLQVVKPTREAGITGAELTNAITGVRAAAIKEARARLIT